MKPVEGRMQWGSAVATPESKDQPAECAIEKIAHCSGLVVYSLEDTMSSVLVDNISVTEVKGLCSHEVVLWFVKVSDPWVWVSECTAVHPHCPKILCAPSQTPLTPEYLIFECASRYKNEDVNVNSALSHLSHIRMETKSLLPCNSF